MQRARPLPGPRGRRHSNSGWERRASSWGWSRLAPQGPSWWWAARQPLAAIGKGAGRRVRRRQGRLARQREGMWCEGHSSCQVGLGSPLGVLENPPHSPLPTSLCKRGDSRGGPSPPPRGVPTRARRRGIRPNAWAQVVGTPPVGCGAWMGNRPFRARLRPRQLPTWTPARAGIISPRCLRRAQARGPLPRSHTASAFVCPCTCDGRKRARRLGHELIAA